ncbi:hypothetical protein HY085_00165 [Candidatus Gottesmanbacteria bacterium]|nr:hypothetical protein [Candidatus Gottesmanbacteria bacterium]
MNDLNFYKKINIEKIASEGAKIYEKIKEQFEPEKNGKFLAIEVDSKETFLGKTSSEALIKAKQKFPDKVFFVVKIGFTVAETIAKSYFK